MKILLIVTVTCIVLVSGQWPLPQSFFDSMRQMTTNMQTMSQNFQLMGQMMAARREAAFAENFLLAQNGLDYGNGKIFVPTTGGLGYAYNSSDGSYTMYVIEASNPPRGFMYHTGINGNQMYNSW
ncbi:hypothetical protein ACF0H5_008967 [Mactra antiquata]